MWAIKSGHMNQSFLPRSVRFGEISNNLAEIIHYGKIAGNF